MAKSIAFSAIAPPDYLDAFVAQEPAGVHHVAAQRVLTDATYRSFFQREAQRGAEIIVDNGVFDLGHALPAADLVAVSLESVRTSGALPASAAETVVFAATAADVREVVSAGRHVVRDGQHALGDVGLLLRNAVHALVE